MCYSVKSFSERNVACMCVSTERITHRVMKKRKQKLYICTDGMLSLVNSWRRDAWCQRETWERPFACYLRNRPYTTASIFISSLETTWLHTFSDTIDKIVSKVNVVRLYSQDRSMPTTHKRDSLMGSWKIFNFASFTYVNKSCWILINKIENSNKLILWILSYI